MINFLQKSISLRTVICVIVGIVGTVGIVIFLLSSYSRTGNLKEVLLEDSFIGQNKLGCFLLGGRWVQGIGIPELPRRYHCYFSKKN